MATDSGDRRYIKESGLEARIAAIAGPVAEGLGYHLVRVRIRPENGMTLQIMAEDAQGRFSISDCENLSRDLSPVLDVEDPIAGEYHLEVSSPGIDRLLVRARDFERWQGQEARIELMDMIGGRKRFRGTIETSDAESVTLRLPDVVVESEAVHRLAFDQIAEAKLMMTDALLDAARLDQEQNDPIGSQDVELVEVSEEETD